MSIAPQTAAVPIKRIILTVVAVGASSAFVAGAVSAPAPPSGEIVVSLELTEPQLFSVAPDGRQEKILTFDAAPFGDPVEDPSGRRIAFSSKRAGQWDVFVGARADSAANVSRHRAHDYDPDWSPDGRQLVFVSDRRGKPELYVMRSDGSRVRRLTTARIADLTPAWSPDGRTIAFTRARTASEGDVWLVPAAGGAPRRLTRDERDNWGPQWSPDSRRLAYTSRIVQAREQPSRIRVIERDGSGLRELTRDRPNGIEQHLFPTWSPDGRQLAFLRTRGEHGLWLVDPDGSRLRRVPGADLADYRELSWSRRGRILFASEVLDGETLVGVDVRTGARRLVEREGTQPRWSRDGRSLAFTRNLGTEGSYEVMIRDDVTGAVRNLTRHAAEDQLASWAPDGSRIAFSSARTEGTLVDIFTASSAGGDVRALVAGSLNDADPDWSPDGRSVLFARFPAANDDAPPGDVYAVDVASGAERRLTTHPATDELARWSPDGRTVVFVSGRTGGMQLFLMNAQGGDQRQLITSTSRDTDPTWSPDGARLAFTRMTGRSVELWIASADGTNPRRLLTGCASEDCLEHHLSPTWRSISRR